MVITAYHGSQDDNLQLMPYQIYLTNDIRIARQFAGGYAFGMRLYEYERPTVYTIEAVLEKPFVIKTIQEYEAMMDISNIDFMKKDLTKNGYDGMVFSCDDGLTYYVALDAKKQCRIIDREELYIA